MREIVFDTETTGLRAENGDRVIELGAVELENRFPTGRNFHVFINPDGKKVDPGAFDVHGISDEFLADKPKFADIVQDFLDFVSDANLVAHNAGFDMNFINAELARLGHAPIPWDRVIDTLAIARRRHPMGPNSLDALCARYSIDNSRRDKHGALLDSELLAEVYIEMNGGRQASLLLDASSTVETKSARVEQMSGERRQRTEPLPSRLTAEDLDRHRAFVEELGEDAIWKRYG
ncbi:MAG: DNA polymerase III subunit epsilon [Salaquimonas sp.]|nr:DNA polymerase III subunit epsilon [Salaquimonas sp.]